MTVLTLEQAKKILREMPVPTHCDMCHGPLGDDKSSINHGPFKLYLCPLCVKIDDLWRDDKMKRLWVPIDELKDKYDVNLLLCAPELVDADCNEHGIGMGYFQDGVGWLACKWSMTGDKWYETSCNPTHFIKMGGP
jgi:hypothetical protein